MKWCFDPSQDRSCFLFRYPWVLFSAKFFRNAEFPFNNIQTGKVQLTTVDRMFFKFGWFNRRAEVNVWSPVTPSVPDTHQYQTERRDNLRQQPQQQSLFRLRDDEYR
jgi:hypothetical protein